MSEKVPEPDSFHPAPAVTFPNTQKPEPIEARPREDLVAKYLLFAQEVHPKSDIIYHPCGADDISLSSVFGRVIYVDLDASAMKAVESKGLEAHVASALAFDPGTVDIAVLLNPQIPPDIPVSHVADGGFVLANDYHGTASALRKNNQYVLQGIIRKSGDGQLIYDRENPGDYWQEIETEAEFQNAPFDWGAIGYQTAAHIVKALTGKKENILAEYRAVVAEERQRYRAEYSTILQEKPELAALLSDPDTEDAFVLQHDGGQLVLQTRLPRKKGTVDDIFVFQKTTEKVA